MSGYSVSLCDIMFDQLLRPTRRKNLRENLYIVLPKDTSFLQGFK